MKAQLVDVVITMSVVDEVEDDEDIRFATTHVFRLDVEMSEHVDTEKFVDYICNYDHVQHAERLVALSDSQFN